MVQVIKISDDGRARAILDVVHLAKYVEIENIIVEQGQRGQGLGSMLLQEIIAEYPGYSFSGVIVPQDPTDTSHCPDKPSDEELQILSRHEGSPDLLNDIQARLDAWQEWTVEKAVTNFYRKNGFTITGPYLYLHT